MTQNPNKGGKTIPILQALTKYGRMFVMFPASPVSCTHHLNFQTVYTAGTNCQRKVMYGLPCRDRIHLLLACLVRLRIVLQAGGAGSAALRQLAHSAAAIAAVTWAPLENTPLELLPLHTDPHFWVSEPGLSGGSQGLCSLAHVSGALGMKHLVAQFGLTLTSPCLGLRLIYLVIIRWCRCTPSLRTGNV